MTSSTRRSSRLTIAFIILVLLIAGIFVALRRETSPSGITQRPDTTRTLSASRDYTVPAIDALQQTAYMVPAQTHTVVIIQPDDLVRELLDRHPQLVTRFMRSVFATTDAAAVTLAEAGPTLSDLVSSLARVTIAGDSAGGISIEGLIGDGSTMDRYLAGVSDSGGIEEIDSPFLQFGAQYMTTGAFGDISIPDDHTISADIIEREYTPPSGPGEQWQITETGRTRYTLIDQDTQYLWYRHTPTTDLIDADDHRLVGRASTSGDLMLIVEPTAETQTPFLDPAIAKDISYASLTADLDGTMTNSSLRFDAALTAREGRTSTVALAFTAGLGTFGCDDSVQTFETFLDANDIALDTVPPYRHDLIRNTSYRCSGTQTGSDFRYTFIFDSINLTALIQTIRDAPTRSDTPAPVSETGTGA